MTTIPDAQGPSTTLGGNGFPAIGAFPLAAGDDIDGAALARFWDDQQELTTGTSKVATLGEAITASIRAGDAIYLGGSLARPNAAAFELTRQFHGSDPRFTIIAPALANQHAVLVHAGLVGKVITALHGNTYPGPGPNPIFTAADHSGSVCFEDWSLLTLVLRLYAAATNVPFLPTRSLMGSDLGRDLMAAGLVHLTGNPFGDDDQVALVPALHPDITVVHSLMADAAGNAVISPPYYEDAWAAFAARRAVIVTTERIVPTDVVRRYAHFVKIPASYVTSVCEVPFGSHPNQLPGQLVPEIDGYYDDYEFLAELREVSRDGEALTTWIKQWVLGLASHDEYLQRLGPARLAHLQHKVHQNGWREEVPSLQKRWTAATSDAELNVVLGARYLHRLVVRRGLRVGLAGVGVSTLSAWLASQSLRRDGISFDLAAEGGMYGFTPLPLDPYLFNYRNLFTSTSLSNVQTVLDVIVGGSHAHTVGVLGAAQVDERGDINSSRINGRMLTGSGGANDIASTAAAVVVTVGHSPQRLPARVEYVTSPGRRVAAIVTDRAVIERNEPGGPLQLTGVLARDGLDKQTLIAEAVNRCGWRLQVGEEVELHSSVTPEEVAATRVFDPEGNFVG